MCEDIQLLSWVQSYRHNHHIFTWPILWIVHIVGQWKVTGSLLQPDVSDCHSINQPLDVWWNLLLMSMCRNVDVDKQNTSSRTQACSRIQTPISSSKPALEDQLVSVPYVKYTYIGKLRILGAVQIHYYTFFGNFWTPPPFLHLSYIWPFPPPCVILHLLLMNVIRAIDVRY